MTIVGIELSLFGFRRPKRKEVVQHDKNQNDYLSNRLSEASCAGTLFCSRLDNPSDQDEKYAPHVNFFQQ